MKISLLLPILFFPEITGTAISAVVFTESFTYPDGALVGNGGWTQNSTIATNPIQVAGGGVTLGTGQDAYNNFATAIPATDGTFAYYGAILNVTAATATGDYFLHFANGLTNPTLFTARLAAQSTAGGYFLGYSESTNAGTTYGTEVLTLNTTYNIIVRYGFVSGTLNDTGAIFVSSGAFNPIEANNTPYVTDTYNGTTGEVAGFTGIQLRQGGGATFPAVTLDNLVVGNTFADVVPIPEVSTAVLGGLAGIALMRRRR